MTRFSGPWWTLVAVSLGGMMVGLDGTALTIAGPDIARTVGASVPELQWIANAYLVALAVALFPAGRLADRAGRRRVFMIGVFGFGLASLAIAVTTVSWLLIVLRAVQGLSGALLQPAALALLRAAFPRERLELALGIWGGAGALSIAAGPIIAGVIVQQYGWPMVFLVNGPIAVATILLTRFAAGESRASGPPEKVRQLLRAPGVGLGAVLTGLSYFSLFGLLFFLTLYLQDVRGLDPVGAGVWLLPLTAVVVLSAPVGGALTARWGPRWPAAAGLTAVGVGMLGFLVLDKDTTQAETLPAALVLGAGTGVALIAATQVIVANAPADSSGLASALQQVATQAGGVTGILVLGTVMPAAVEPDAFLSGLHTAVVLAAAVVAVGAVIASVLCPAGPPDVPSRVDGQRGHQERPHDERVE